MAGFWRLWKGLAREGHMITRSLRVYSGIECGVHTGKVASLHEDRGGKKNRFILEEGERRGGRGTFVGVAWGVGSSEKSASMLVTVETLSSSRSS